MEKLDRIANGFQEAKVLLVGAELGIFERVRGGATAEQVARATGGSLRGIEILLDALVAIEVLRKERGVYRNDPECEPHLLEDAAGHFVAMLRHRNLMFRRWAELEDVILGRVAEAASGRPNLEQREPNENFIRAMYAVTHRLAPALVDLLDLRGVRRVADLGGGPGVYLEEIARRSSAIELWLVDLPLTLEVARRILASSPAASRIRFVAWNLFAQQAPPELPAMDLLLLSQVLHGEPPEQCRVLLHRLRERLVPGGLLVIHERLVDEDRTAPRDAALFAVNMLAMTPGGRAYTEREIHTWGREAGLVPEPSDRIEGRSWLLRLRRP